MDADEMLARALQEEEMAAARQQQQPAGPDEQKAALMGIISDGLRKALSVEDPAVLAQARSVVPFDALQREAQQTADLNAQLGVHQQQAGPTLGIDDLLVQELLQYFKRDFFSWVDQPSCQLCSGPTSLQGMAATPTPAEAADGAGRVEVYHCSVCQQITRFPRYVNPRKLLEARKGRCGEWAHTFLLVLRAAGLDARHVTDNADHVWCEYYSSSLDRWVHVDACEAAWDTPLLYEGGWGKQLSYVFAASRHGVADVSRRYVLQPQLLHSRRTQVPEAWLSVVLSQQTSQLRANLDASTRRAVGLRDAAEALQLMSLEDNAGAAAAAANLPGRQSGAEAWRSARGETGTVNTPAAAPAATKPPTPYRHAPDSTLPPLFTSAGRLTGGVCHASGENRAGNPSQQPIRLFDGSLRSKWLDFGGGGIGGTAWAEYRLLPNQDACVISHYDVISAEDCPERDPCDWVFECIPLGSAVAMPSTAECNTSNNDNSNSSSGSAWVVIDRQQGQRFSRRHQLRSFMIPESARQLSKQWRLRITRTADPAAANSVQIACWNLYSSSLAQQQSQRQAPKASHAYQADDRSKTGATVAGASAFEQLLYISSQAHTTIRNLLCGKINATEATGSATVAAAADSDIDSAESEQQLMPVRDAAAFSNPGGLSTLKRILTNMQRYPSTQKFWQVSAAAAALQPVLQEPLLLFVLFEAGFRPVLWGSEADGQLQLRLIADETCARNVEFVNGVVQQANN